MNASKINTRKLVLTAIITAMVVILQLMGAFIHFGQFSVSIVLIPIVIGAATCGTAVSAWLGLVFGITVLLSGDAALFLSIDFIGTIITVLLKGVACGLVAGLVYNMLKKKNKYLAVLASAIVCPIVNTGVFLLGCEVFFMDTITAWANGSNIIYYMLVGLVGGNFIFELAFNVILSPIVLRLLNIKQK